MIVPHPAGVTWPLFETRRLFSRDSGEPRFLNETRAYLGEASIRAYMVLE